MPTITLAATLVSLLATVVDTGATVERWDPQWLAIMVTVAVVLVAAAVCWWLFLVVRVQDLWRDSSSYRRTR